VARRWRSWVIVGGHKVAEGKLRITWVKSSIGYSQEQKATIKALGLRSLGQTVVKEDHPAIRGMVKAVEHLVRAEEVEEGTPRSQELRGDPGEER